MNFTKTINWHEAENTEIELIQDDQHQEWEQNQPKRRYRENRKLPSSFPGMITYKVGLTVNNHYEPNSVKEVLSCKDSDKWKHSMREELDSF